MSRFIFTYSVLFMLNLSSVAQQPSMYQYTVADGLPSNYVYNVVQDDDGFIWAYTENGVARFDGYHWKSYSSQDGLPSNDVYYLLKDKNGILWGQTSSREQFGIKNGKVIIPSTKELTAAAAKFERQVYFVGARMVQLDSLGQSKTLFPFTVEGKENHFQTSDSVSICVSLESSSSISVRRTINGKEKILLDKVRVAPSPLTAQFATISSTNYYVVLLKDRIDLYRIDGDNDATILYADHAISYENYLIAQTTDEGLLQLLSDKGCWVFDNHWQLKQSWSDEEFTSKYDINGCRFDRENNLWIGTRSNGIFFLPRQKLKTSILTLAQPSESAFEGIIQTPNKTIFAANDNGTMVMLSDEEIAKTFQTGNKKNRYAGISYDQESDVVSAHFRPGRISIKSTGKPVALQELGPYAFVQGRKQQTGEYQELLLNALYMARQTLRYSNYIFVYNHYGVYRASKSEPTGKLLFTFADTPLRGPYPYSCVAQDSIYTVDTVGTKAIYFSDRYDVTDVLPLKDHTFLIGTQSSGLLQFDPRDGTIEQVIDTKFVKRIKYEGGCFLMASYAGSYVFDKTLKLLHHFTTLDGLPSNEVNDLCLKDGKLYSATGSGIGITRLPLRPIESDTLTDLKVINYKIDGQPTKSLDALQIGTSTISMEHPLTHYASHRQITYEYRLLPHEQGWSQSASPTTILYGLDADSYEFQLRAIDAYGGIHLAEPVSFTIPKPIYHELWFQGLLAFLFLGGIFAYYRSRDKAQKVNFVKEQALAFKMADLKLSALRSQMNPHFIFNALGSIQYFIQTSDSAKADEYLSNFAMLMRRILESSKSKYISLRHEIETLQLYVGLEAMRFEGLFDFEITVGGDVDLDFKIPPMVLQPYVENAINHGLHNLTGRKGKLSIAFEEFEDHQLKVTIADNGIGRKAAEALRNKKHRSRGMQIVDDRVATINDTKELKIESQVNDQYDNEGNATGTIVVVVFIEPLE